MIIDFFAFSLIMIVLIRLDQRRVAETTAKKRAKFDAWHMRHPDAGRGSQEAGLRDKRLLR
jgi:hypothetical protein